MQEFCMQVAHLLEIGDEDASVKLHDDQDCGERRAEVDNSLAGQPLAIRVEEALQELHIVLQHVHIIHYEPPGGACHG